MATQEFESFNGKLDATTEFEPFDGALDGEPQKPSGAIRRIADQGIKLAQGVVGVPEAAVGVADLVTGGQAGKLVESAGVRFKDAKQVLGEYLSPEQQAADADVAKAEGFLPTLGAMVRNPSTIIGATVESAPSMLLGGAASRGILAAAPKIGAIAAGAAGEGITAAGQNAEQVRQEDPSGTLTGKQSALLAGSGVLTGAISGAAGKLANKFGIGDVQTMLAQGKLGVVGEDAAQSAGKKGLARKIAEGFASEGVLQELPQSYQEQVAQNLAQDKPWDEGAAKAGAQGLMAGALMGGGANAAAHFAQSPTPAAAVAPEQQTSAPNLSLDPQNLATVQSEEFGSPDVPQTAAPDGRAILNAQQEQERLQQEAQIAANRAVTGPDDEILASTGAVDRVRKPSEAMGLDPAASPMSAAATIAVDTGVHQANLDQAQADADQAAYDSYIAQQDEEARQQDTADKPLTRGPLAEAAMSDEDKRAVLFSNQSVADGGRRYPGTQDGDILNGTGSPFSTYLAAGRRANMEGKDWIPVKIGDKQFVTRRKDANVSTSDRVQPVPEASSGNDGAQPTASVGSGTTDSNGMGANGAGLENGSVGQSGELPRKSVIRPVGNAQPKTTQAASVVKRHTSLPSQRSGQREQGTQEETAAKADLTPQPGADRVQPSARNRGATVDKFQASSTNDTSTSQNVKDNPPAAAGTQAKAAPVETPAPAPGNAAAPNAIPGTGSAAVQADGVNSRPDFMRSEDRMRNSIDSAAQELAMTVHNESEQDDFNAKEVPQVIAQWAKDANVPTEDLRNAFKAEIEKRDFVQKSAVLQAINPVPQDASAAKKPNFIKAARDKRALLEQENARLAAENKPVKKSVIKPKEQPSAQTAEAIQSPSQPEARAADAAVAEPATDGGVAAEAKAKAIGSAFLPAELSAKLQEAHKANGRDVTLSTVQKAYDRVMKSLITGKGSNGGVQYDIKPKERKELQAQADRLTNDLSLFGEQAPSKEMKPKKNVLRAKMEQARQARADYFTPGNIVTSYGGFDEVLSYTPKDDGGFSVKVHEVKKVDGQWVRQGKPQDARTHSTQPDAKAMAKGPVERVAKDTEQKPTISFDVTPEQKAAADKEIADLNQRLGTLLVKDGKVYRRTPSQDGYGTSAKPTTFDAYVGDVGSGAANTAIAKAKIDGKEIEGLQNQQQPAQPDSVLSISMGGSNISIDLGKPAWQATDDDLVKSVKDAGYSWEQSGKYNPMKPWREAHSESLAKAVKDGKPVPAEVLYDKPGLIRGDLNADDADLASDAMVDVYRATNDYGKAVQEYRDFGKVQPAAQEPANDRAMFSRTSGGDKSSVLSKNGKFQGWPKFNKWTRREYNDVVSLLPKEYRDDPHRREPLSTKDRDAYTASALSEIKALNEGIGDRGFGVDSLGNLTGDMRDGITKQDIQKAADIADRHGLGVFVTGVKTGSIQSLLDAGFVSEYGLGIVLARETKSKAPPRPMPDNAYGNTAYGTMMSYKPRGFAAPMFSHMENIRTPYDTPSTVQEVQKAIRQLIGITGRNKLGGTVATTAAEIKSTWEPLTGQNVNIESEGDAGRAQAYFDPKTNTVFLIADHIRAGTEMAVAAHELMHKHGQTVLGKDGWNKLHSVISTWANADSESDERLIYNYAASKVRAVGESLSSQELFPYAVEGALKAGYKPNAMARQGTVQKWLAGVIQSMKDVWAKVTGKPDAFKVQDMVDLAFGIAQMENPELAAVGGFKSTDQTDTSAFRKWFGDSKVVDADGKPLAVYHGTTKDFNKFSNGTGWFTADAGEANFWGGTNADGANVVPAYLSIKNPRILQASEASRNRINDALEALHNEEDGVLVMEDGKIRWAVVAEPTQIKSAIGNNGQFNPTNADIRYSMADTLTSAINQRKETIVGDTNRYTPEMLAAMKTVGWQVEQPSLKERAQALWKDAGKKMAQGIVDQFSPVKAIDGTAYGLLRLAKGASGAFEVFLKGGQLKLTDNVYDTDTSKRGGVIDRLLTPLQGEHHDFMRWVAVNRAERLLGEGKENLFTKESIEALKKLADGTTNFDYKIQNGIRKGKTTRNRLEIYRDSNVTFSEFQKNILDLAEQSGIIDGEARNLWENEFYIPFYRVEDNGSVAGAHIKNGVVRQEAFKSLTGRTNKLNADLLDNTLMNWAHLLDASAKNRAAKATIEAIEKMGAAIPLEGSIGKGSVWFRENGQKRWAMIDDPYLLAAVSALEYAGMRNPAMNAMGAMKHALTVGVTASPFFKVRNLIRDSVQVIGTGNISYNPAKNLSEGWKLTDPKSDAYFRLLAGGGTIHFGTMMEGSEAKRVQSLVESGVDNATILNSDHKFKAFYRKFVEPGITAYNELGNRGESVNRAALYNQLINQGFSHAEASLQARDLMDFSMQGSWTSIRFLSQVVPFFNARIQGMYKLGKSAKENPARFSAVLGATSLFSLALLAAYSDDDDWKKREDWDRNNFWWFKFGGTAFRIPKPFEIGAIATLAERGFELAFDKEMTDKRFMAQVVTLLGDNLSMNPVPQLVKPILDVYSNTDSFSGRPIETMGMDRLKSDYRFTDRTSMAARAASTGINAVTGLINKEGLSPVQIDHMLRGYFGWLGTMVVGAGDVLARPATGQATHPAPNYMKTVTGGMASDLRDAPSRYVSQMYEQAKVIEQAYGTWRALLKEGKTQEAGNFLESNRSEISKYRAIENVKRIEASANSRIRMVERSSMTSDEKREKIREITQQKDRAARAVAG